MNHQQSLVLLTSIYLSLSTTQTYAAVNQVFLNLTYSNPAALSIIKNNEFIVGTSILNLNNDFTGTVGNVAGSATSHQTDSLPYGRFAGHLSPKIVAGIDITQPYYQNFQYPIDSIINESTTKFIFRDVDFSPRLSYQVTNKLSLGVGFNANKLYEGEFDFVVPVAPFPGAPAFNLVNVGKSWGYGWNIGLLYQLAKGTFFDMSYYSQIGQNLKGNSYFGPISSANTTSKVQLPATTTISLTQFFSEDFLINGTFHYAQWDVDPFLTLNNTAIGTIVIPQYLTNTWTLQLSSRYQINSTWAALGSVSYDSNAQAIAYRLPGYPLYGYPSLAIGCEYTIKKGLKAGLMYGYAFANAPINTINDGLENTGRSKFDTNMVDFSLTYDI